MDPINERSPHLGRFVHGSSFSCLVATWPIDKGSARQAAGDQ